MTVHKQHSTSRLVPAICGAALKAQVQGLAGTLVTRPDSGDPVEIPLQTLEAL